MGVSGILNLEMARRPWLGNAELEYYTEENAFIEDGYQL